MIVPQSQVTPVAVFALHMASLQLGIVLWRVGTTIPRGTPRILPRRDSWRLGVRCLAPRRSSTISSTNRSSASRTSRAAASTLPSRGSSRGSGSDGSSALTAVQAHQQHAVHAFLVQLAALALTRAGAREVAHEEPAWRALLLDCARADGAGAEAFALVVADLAKPAFLQPPVPEGTLVGLKSEHARPSEELDVLITAKNHDVKVDRVESPSIEHWVYALVTLQTMQGFLGAGNYGIARMNGGFASRPCVAFASAHGAAARFARDVEALLGARVTLVDRFGFGAKGQLGLVWCAPWDGRMSLAFDALDPFFIEVCRRIRLTCDDGVIVAHRGSSKVPRIDTKELSGHTGDAWTPVDGKDGKALTMTEEGFTYERVRRLLFGEYQPGAAGKARPDGSDRLWLGQVLVRGQGKTGGYHERWVPVPPKARRMFTVADERAKLGKCAQRWVELAATARLRVLKPAILRLVQGGPENPKFDDARAEPYFGAPGSRDRRRLLPAAVRARRCECGGCRHRVREGAGEAR